METPVSAPSGSPKLCPKAKPFVPMINNDGQEEETNTIREVAIVAKIDFWMSPDNLYTDVFMLKQVLAKDGWVDVQVFTTFKKMQKLNADCESIVNAVRHASQNLVLSNDAQYVKNNVPLTPMDHTLNLSTTIYVGKLHPGSTIQSVKRLFKRFGRIFSVVPASLVLLIGTSARLPSNTPMDNTITDAFIQFEKCNSAKYAMSRINKRVKREKAGNLSAQQAVTSAQASMQSISSDPVASGPSMVPLAVQSDSAVDAESAVRHADSHEEDADVPDEFSGLFALWKSDYLSKYKKRLLSKQPHPSIGSNNWRSDTGSFVAHPPSASMPKTKTKVSLPSHDIVPLKLLDMSRKPFSLPKRDASSSSSLSLSLYAPKLNRFALGPPDDSKGFGPSLSRYRSLVSLLQAAPVAGAGSIPSPAMSTPV